jgi:excisionase family DNA binding protein
MNGKAVYTTFEAAKLCHVSPLSIINWVNAGRLAAFRTPGGHRRIRREDLVVFMRDSGLPLPDELKQGFGKRRVLVVDGDGGTRDALGEHLRNRPRSYDVQTAADSFEAGRLIATFRPDAVVLDARLPGLDGFQVCRAIKAHPDSAATLVVLTAGPAAGETDGRVAECGAARCFARPIDPQSIAEFVDAAFDQQTNPRSRRGRSARL